MNKLLSLARNYRLPAAPALPRLPAAAPSWQAPVPYVGGRALSPPCGSPEGRGGGVVLMLGPVGSGAQEGTAEDSPSQESGLRVGARLGRRPRGRPLAGT